MCLLTIAAYAGSLSGWFLYEDDILPERTHLIRALVPWSHAATQWLVGDGPMPARMVNLGWHVLNGVLLWLLVRPVVQASIAIVAVGLFLLHPIQTESVAYLASRAELIAGMWLLLACLAASRGWLWLAGICAALTLTGKEMGVMAWLVVPLWAWAIGQVWTRRQMVLWGGASAVMLGAFTWKVVTYPGLFAVMPWTFYGAQVAALWRMVLILPEALIRPAVLTIDHDWNWMTAPVALAALVFTAALVERAIRHSRLLAFALVGTLLVMLPRLVIPMPDGLHERHLYSAMPALCLWCGAALFPKEA